MFDRDGSGTVDSEEMQEMVRGLYSVAGQDTDNLEEQTASLRRALGDHTEITRVSDKIQVYWIHDDPIVFIHCYLTVADGVMLQEEFVKNALLTPIMQSLVRE